MKLHENKEIFSQAIVSAAEYLNIQEVFVEKDYWVTYMLKNLSNSKHKDLIVFKGGTSLSKAYKLINRFSEDVDLAVIPAKEVSGNKIKNLLKEVEVEITKGLNEVVMPGITSKGSKFRKTVFGYPRVVEGNDFGQASEKLLLEINSFANPHPYVKMPVQSMIAHFLMQTERKEAVESYDLKHFSINVLGLERTLTEKLLSLVRASYAESPINEWRARIRHIYDLHFILSKTGMRKFVSGITFKRLIQEVLTDDESNSQFKGDWTKKPISTSQFFYDWKNIWKELQPTYHGDFKKLVFSDLPDVSAIDESICFILNAAEKLDK